MIRQGLHLFKQFTHLFEADVLDNPSLITTINIQVAFNSKLRVFLASARPCNLVLLQTGWCLQVP